MGLICKKNPLPHCTHLLHSASLLPLPYAGNVVIKADKLDERNILLTLQKPQAKSFTEKDVVENIAWMLSTPIHNDIITCTSSDIEFHKNTFKTANKIKSVDELFEFQDSAEITVTKNNLQCFSYNSISTYCLQQRNIFTN